MASSTFSLEPVDEAPAKGGASTFSLEAVDETPRQRGYIEDVAISAAKGAASWPAAIIDAANPQNLIEGTKDFASRLLLPQDFSKPQAPLAEVPQEATKALDAAMGQAQTLPGRMVEEAVKAAPAGGVPAMVSAAGAVGTGELGKAIDKGIGGSGTTGEVVGSLVGAVAAPALAAKSLSKLVNVFKGEAAAVPEAVGGKTVSAWDKAGEVQGVLKQGQAKVAEATNKLYTQASKELEGKVVPWQNINESLVKPLMLAQAGLQDKASVDAVTNAITGIGRFIEGGLDVPANQLVQISKALSKASTKNAAIRPIVEQLDAQIVSLGGKTYPKAREMARMGFELFDDQDAVAKAVTPGTTPGTVAKLLTNTDTQAADKFDQIMKAVKDTGGDVKSARKLTEQAVVHNVLEKSMNMETGRVVVKDYVTNLNELKRNKGLWDRLSPSIQQDLNLAAKNLQDNSTLKKGAKAAVRGAMRFFGFGDAAQAVAGGTEAKLGAVFKAMKDTTVGGVEAAKRGAPAGVAAALRQTGETTPEGQMIEGAVSTAKGMVSPPGEPVEGQPAAEAPQQPATPQVDIAPAPDFNYTPPPEEVSKTVIIQEEGVQDKVYRDTEGKKTVGAGFNMDQAGARAIWGNAGIKESFNDVYAGLVPLSPASIDKLYKYTGPAARNAAKKIVSNFDKLGSNQQAALTSLTYQLGSRGMAGFKKTLKYLEEGNAKAVENSLLASKMAKQSPARTRRMALMLAYDMDHAEADRYLARTGRIKENERKYL